MPEFTMCLACSAPCCKTALAVASTFETIAEIPLDNPNPKIEALVVTLQQRIDGMLSSMATADLSVRGIILDIYEDTPGLLEVFWHIQFECGFLTETSSCANWENRPHTCKSYACLSVDPDSDGITKEALAAEADDLDKLDWTKQPQTPEEVRPIIMAKIRQLSS